MKILFLVICIYGLARYYLNRAEWLQSELVNYLNMSKEMIEYIIENKKEYYHDGLPIAVCVSIPSYMKMLFISTEIDFKKLLKDQDIVNMVDEFDNNLHIFIRNLPKYKAMLDFKYPFTKAS